MPTRSGAVPLVLLAYQARSRDPAQARVARVNLAASYQWCLCGVNAPRWCSMVQLLRATRAS